MQPHMHVKQHTASFQPLNRLSSITTMEIFKEKQQLPVHCDSSQMYSIIMSQYNTIRAHVANTGYPEQGLTLRLTSSPDIITV